MSATPNAQGCATVKKDFAEMRIVDEKVIRLPFEASIGSRIDDVPVASLWSLRCKRAIDLAFAMFVLVFGLPFYALIAILIKLTTEGPVLFVQDRVGKDEVPFKLYKFRTMGVGNSDDEHRHFTESFIKGNVSARNEDGNGRTLFKLTVDPRVTSIGKFLRRTSLDELPQFINVFKGEMSLVGPRPPLTYELEHYQEWHKGRLAAKPGLTGLWQVSGRSTVPFEEMVHLDLLYIRNWSLLLDVKIILRTIPVMLFGLGGY